jgi:hypothetical protein
LEPCCSSGGLSLASHRGGAGSIPGQVTWDLWWTKWHWGRFCPSTSVSPCQFSFHQMLHSDLPSGAGTIGQLVDQVVCLTSLHEIKKKFNILQVFFSWDPNIFLIGPRDTKHKSLKIVDLSGIYFLYFAINFIFLVSAMIYADRKPWNCGYHTCIISWTWNSTLRPVILMKSTVFWVVTPCSLDRAPSFGRNILPRSSGSRSKPSKTPTEADVTERICCWRQILRLGFGSWFYK